MINLPANCGNCGLMFPSGYVFDSCKHISIKSCFVQCPRCRGMAKVVEGIFNIIDDNIEVLSGPQITEKTVEKLNVLLMQAQKGEISPEEIKAKVTNDIPELALFSRYFPKTSSDLVAWLVLLVMVIQTIESLAKDDNKSSKVIIEQTINNTYNYYSDAGSQPQKNRTPKSRNSPCDCGSGLRFKYCCGSKI
jgi:hypothetical protein